MKRIIAPIGILAVSIGCTSNSGAPLGPSAVGAGHSIVAQPGSGVTSTQVSWTCVTTPDLCGPSRIMAAADLRYAAIDGPINPTAVVNGSTVTLAWQPPPGVAPTGYVLEAGSGPGRSDIALFIYQSTATTITVNNVPNNTYYVRLRAILDNCCATATSVEIVVVVGQPPPPCLPAVSPTSTAAPSAGGTLTFAVSSTCSWTAMTNSPFLSITSGSSGTGNGTVTVSVAQNTGSSRSGTLTIAGVVVTINQGSSGLSVSFVLIDGAAQTTPTMECRIRSNPTTCQLRSTSFTFGPNAIVSYGWTVEYTYNGTTRTLTETEETPEFSFTDVCGGEEAATEGTVRPLSVQLTITDSDGDTATAIAGVGGQPALFVRLYTCS